MADLGDKDWRAAKIPQWVKDAVQAEIDQLAMTAALSWPTEANPAPMPFQWGDYDNLRGEPIPGKYWTKNGHILEIRPKAPTDKGHRITEWKSWVFRTEGGEWTTDVQRGPLFSTQREAKLARLWDQCEAAAKTLLNTRKWMLS